MFNRRKFIKSTAAMAALSAVPLSAKSVSFTESTKPERIFPSRLKPGDTIALITPGSSITEEQLHQMVVKIEGLGFKTFYKESVLAEYGYFAGKDQERANELMEMFTNPAVDAIMCARGGYGSIRILDKIDFTLIKQNPKIFIGYSDITALITAIFKKTGLITFHGPLGVSPFNDFTKESFERVLMNPSWRYKYPYLREPETENNPEFDLYTISPGKAKGELVGGNLSVLDSMIGSEFEPDFENKIVFIEEIEEKTYRVDKMLYHLIYATNLNKAAGIALGVFNECNVNDKPALSLRQAIADLLKPLNIPVSYGLPFGHIDTILTIPTGITAKLNTHKNSLTLLEKAVV